MKNTSEIKFTDELVGILYERTNAGYNLADAVTKTERQYWSGVVDALDLVIRIMTDFPSNEVYAELDRRNGYTVS